MLQTSGGWFANAGVCILSRGSCKPEGCKSGESFPGVFFLKCISAQDSQVLLCLQGGSAVFQHPPGGSSCPCGPDSCKNSARVQREILVYLGLGF